MIRGIRAITAYLLYKYITTLLFEDSAIHGKLIP